MDISEFIEQDILIFLDDRLDTKAQGPTRADKAESTVFITKDYEKEMIGALEQENIPGAKQVLHDLKDQLDTSPPGPDREHLKALLLSLYERFKDYLDARHLSIDDPALGFRSTAGTQPSPEPQAAEPRASPVQPASAQMPPANTLSKIHELEQKIEQSISEQRIKDAMVQYREVKALTTTLPTIPQDLALRLITLFGHIKQMDIEHKISEIHKQGKQQPKEATRSIAQTPGATLDRDLLLQLEQEKKAMDAALHASDIGTAMARYKNMRMIAQQINDRTLSQKTAEKLQRIYEIISSMKNHSAHNELQLAKVTP